MNLWLFDLDGVLIRPGGYREALRRTVMHFSALAGYPQRRLEESAIEAFEAHGITCEWDIAGICLMAEVYAVWKANPALRLPPDLDACLSLLRGAGLSRPEPDFAGWARQTGALSGDTPAASAVKLFKQKAGDAEPDPARAGEFESVLTAVLGRPREFPHSPVMRYFQQFTLGSRAYAEHYRVPPEIETPSLLAELDRPGLSDDARDRILDGQSQKRICSAIITARPCRPPDPGAAPGDSPPEAEIAQRIIGLEKLPLVGAGQMQWLARRRGQIIDAYLKPSPVHSLAALAAAMGAGGPDSLDAARAFVEEGKILPPFDRFSEKRSDIAVFEDSPTGVIGTASAVDLLKRKAIDVRISLYGVAAGGEKRAALESLGAIVFRTTDEALAEAWKSLS
ncbi:MAG: hypothetical protein JW929_14025 [Anaerolineales bacterium]|nr:hypothetical protein [Anaerolineales bacterium]